MVVVSAEALVCEDIRAYIVVKLMYKQVVVLCFIGAFSGEVAV